jgi:valyl-tRNA synthetase
VTEELFSRLHPAMTKLGLWMDAPPDSEMLALDRYPKPRKTPQPEIEERFAILQRFVVSARQLRSVSNIKDNIKVVVEVKPLAPQTRVMLEQAKAAVCFLAKLEDVRFTDQRNRGMAAQYDPAFELYLDLGRYIDLKVEIERLDKEIAKSEKDLASTEKTLATPGFAERAPPDKVQATIARKDELKERLSKLAATRTELASIVATGACEAGTSTR